MAEPNSFAQVVTEAAFNKGGQWLDEMREYVFTNRKIAEDFIEKEIPGISIVHGEATYLLWIDISALGKESADVAAAIRAKTGLYITEGIEYGEAGRYFLRMNVACTRATLLDGLNRLKDGIKRVAD